jgi:hypothetical protein
MLYLGRIAWTIDREHALTIQTRLWLRFDASTPYRCFAYVSDVLDNQSCKYVVSSLRTQGLLGTTCFYLYEKKTRESIIGIRLKASITGTGFHTNRLPILLGCKWNLRCGFAHRVSILTTRYRVRQETTSEIETKFLDWIERELMLHVTYTVSSQVASPAPNTLGCVVLRRPVESWYMLRKRKRNFNFSGYRPGWNTYTIQAWFPVEILRWFMCEILMRIMCEILRWFMCEILMRIPCEILMKKSDWFLEIPTHFWGAWFCLESTVDSRVWIKKDKVTD